MGLHDAHTATEKSKAEVSALVSFGNTQEDIAKYIGISVDTLARHYKHELDTAIVKANAQIANKLFRKATEGDDLQAMVFWLKTRGRWRTVDKEDKEKDSSQSILEKIISGELKINQK